MRCGPDVPSRGIPIRDRIDRYLDEPCFKEWGQIFDVDNTLATAMIDRLMHHGEAILIHGDSYRTKDATEEEISPLSFIDLSA